MNQKAIDWALNQEAISANEKLVLIILADYSNKDNESCPTRKTICKRTCLCLRTVTNCLNNLCLAGLISWSNLYREDGSTKSNLYKLNIPSNTEPGMSNTGQSMSNTGQGMSNTGHHMSTSDARHAFLNWR